MLADSPVVRSPGARVIFLLSAGLMLAILAWNSSFGARPGTHGLTYIYYLLFVTMDHTAAMGALLILVCAALLPFSPSCRVALRWIDAHIGLAAVTVAIILCIGSLVVYQDHRLAMDEYAQFFQSQVFAAGHLTGRFPPSLVDWLIPRGFQNYFLFVSRSTGAVASTYWPSFALLLAPFTWLGIPWACNPLISALTLVAVHALALRIFADREAAALAALLTAASPVFFANGISYYSMPAHLLANTLFAIALANPTPRRALIAGVIGSIALTLHNPLPHALFALPWIVWLAMRPQRLPLLSSLAAGYAPLCLLLGLGWFWFTNDFRHEGASAGAAAGAQIEGLRRAATAFALPTPTLLLARLIGMMKVCIWAVPGIALLAALGAWRWRHDTVIRLLLASAATTFAGYLFVAVDQGHGWGFRYFHSAWMCLPILAAGLFVRPVTANANDGFFADEYARALVVVCALLTLVFGSALRAVQIHEFIARHREQQPACPAPECPVVIIDASFSSYGADLVQNDPWLRGGVVRMISNGASADARMMREHFPDMRRVGVGRYGSAWSSASTEPSTRAPAQQGLGGP